MKKYSLITPIKEEIGFKTKNYEKASDFIWRNKVLTQEYNEKDFYLLMKVKAKKTDVIQDLFKPEGMLISNKLKLILEKFKLPEHRFYSATIVHKNKEHEYHWLQINTPFERNPVNKTKSILSDEYDLNTYAYESVAKSTESTSETTDIGFKSVVRLHQDLLPYDLFRLQSGAIHTKFCPFPFIISQELKAALIENKITGIGIIDANIQAE